MEVTIQYYISAIVILNIMDHLECYIHISVKIEERQMITTLPQYWPSDKRQFEILFECHEMWS